MKKIIAILMATLMVLGLTVNAFAYTDPTGYGNYGYNNYGYNNGYGYNNYNYYNCTGMRTMYSDEEYNPSSWFEQYADEYGVVFHLYPTRPISRSDVFAPVGKAMDMAYEDAGRNFSNGYGVGFVDFTWDYSLYDIAAGLYQRGIMIGYPEDNTVRFPNNITRAEFAKVVYLTAQQNGIATYSNSNVNYQFTDMVGHWASKYASQCQALGLLVGRGNGYFDPNGYVTYEEYVTVMLRIAEVAGRSNYSMEFDDIAYGISSTMDIDFEGYEFAKDFDLSVSGSKTIYLSVGDTKELKVKATPSDIELSKSDVEWEASKSGYIRFSNKSIESDRYAVVDIKALKEGKLTVTAVASKDYDVEVKFNIIISDDEEYEDDEIYVTSITVNPTTVNLSVGESKAITATIKPTNATNKGITWKSHNTNVATVSQSGKITAVGVGNTTVTAEAIDGSGVVAAIDVTVTAETIIADNKAPEVQITGANIIKRDEFVTLTVTALDENLASFELKKSDILGMTSAGVSVHEIKKVSNNEYKVVLLGMETAIGEICIAAGVAVDTAGNRSAETDGVAIKVNPLD